MNYFTTILSSQAHTLRLPSQSKDDIERYVLQHQKGNASPERAPFRRQLDFWAFAIASAIANGTPPLNENSAKWGRKFADTRSVEMPDGLWRNTCGNRASHARSGPRRYQRPSTGHRTRK